MYVKSPNCSPVSEPGFRAVLKLTVGDFKSETFSFFDLEAKVVDFQLLYFVSSFWSWTAILAWTELSKELKKKKSQAARRGEFM